MREAEDQLKVIPQFCFPDAKDWAPVDNFPRYQIHMVYCHYYAIRSTFVAISLFVLFGNQLLIVTQF